MVKKIKNKPKLLLVGDAVATTGFARVMHGIFENLVDRYEIHHLGINYRGDPHDYKVKIYPAMLGGLGQQGDVYGHSRLPRLIDSLQPDVVFILNDIWIHAQYMDALDSYIEGGLKVVLYSPVDAEPIEWSWVKKIRKAKRFVAYTQFGKRVVEDSLESWQKHIERHELEEEQVEFPPIGVVPHGVDTSTFYPLPDSTDKAGNVVIPGKLNAKRMVFPNKEDFLNSFVVLNANRNQPRKRIDITLKGFAKFAEDKPDNVKLYLHMGVEDMGWNILALADRYHIDHRLIISANVPMMPQVPDSRLNEIYNACDVGINTSMGEGWGLVSFEHASTKAAQIVPNHSAAPEIWGDSAEYLDPKYYLTTDRILTEGAILDPDQLADKLQKLYDDPVYLREMSEKAYAVTQREEYQWPNVAEKMATIIDEVLNE